MPSSAPPPEQGGPPADPTAEQIAEVAARLSGAAVRDVRRGAASGNNRIYRVETAAGTVALKCYPRLSGDPRDRLGTEFAALDFLGRNGETAVPRALAADREAGMALYSWVEGEPPGSPGSADIDAAADFAARLHALARAPGAEALPAASEACLSGTELVAQVERRLARLGEVAPEFPDLAAFLDGGLRPALGRWRGAAEGAYGEDLAPVRRTLSPSDFGFHNALRGADGGLVFVDFEYFGWDDPVKLTADVLLHPGMRLSDGQKLQFLTRMLGEFGADAAFPARFGVLYPLYALRWCLILLNEFLPERWKRRAFAGAADRGDAQTRQLAKARDLLEILQQHDGRPPFDR